MTIKALYPASKPTLDLDFANTKRMDPRVTFTRASTATYYDGVTQAKAEENLLIGSVNPSASGWTANNGIAGSLGTELVTNGEFDSLTGWTLNNGSIDSGQLTLSDVTNARAEQYSTVLVPAGIYKIVIDVATNTGGFSIQTNASGAFSINAVTGIFTTGIVVAYFTAPSNQTNGFRLIRTSGSQVFNSISIQRVISTNATAPDGTATATLATAEAADAIFLQPRTVIAGDHTFSVFLRRVTGSGNVDITCHDGGTWVTQSGVVTGSGWARYNVTQTLTAGTRNPGVRITTSGDQVEIWGAQFEQRSFATAYTPTVTSPITNYVSQLSTAAIDQPRFEHTLSGSESLGLLVEEARTNYIYSSDPTVTASWSPAATFSTNSTISPQGTIINSLTNDPRSVNVNIGAVAKTLSFFVKSDASTTGSFQTVGGGWGSDAGTFAFDLVARTFSGGIVESFSNGWFRLSRTFTAASSGTLGNIFNCNGLYLWGVQFEAGASPSSYIPTTANIVTRSADSMSITGTIFNNFYERSEGTICWEARPINATVDSTVYAFSDGTTANRISQSYLSSSIASRIRTFGTVYEPSGVGTATSNALGRGSLSMRIGDAAAAFNGAAPTTSSGVVMPLVDRLTIGASFDGSAPLNGTLRSFVYWPSRLSNGIVQALTAS